MDIIDKLNDPGKYPFAYLDAIAEIKRLRELTTPRPMEAAPKDGSYILAYPCFSNKNYYQVKWRQSKRGGWEHWNRIVPLTPTQWIPMPLPEPPQVTK